MTATTTRDVVDVLWHSLLIRLMSNRPSRSGVGEPDVTTAAIGARPAASKRLKVKWQNPCNPLEGRKVVKLFTVPLWIAVAGSHVNR